MPQGLTRSARGRDVPDESQAVPKVERMFVEHGLRERHGLRVVGGQERSRADHEAVGRKNQGTADRCE